MDLDEGIIKQMLEASEQACIVLVVGICAAMVVGFSIASIGDQSWGELLSELTVWGAI